MSTLRLSSLRAPLGHAKSSLHSTGFRRSFQSGRTLAAGKESELHVEDRAQRVEYEKQEQLKKQKEGRAEWSDSLSSDSESVVKADRGEIKGGSASIKELQEETVKKVEDEKVKKSDK